MADAKICDRCGEYYEPAEDAPDLYVTDTPYVSITVTENDLTRLSNRAAPIDPKPRSTTKNAHVETKDLCESCREDLQEFWEDGGDA